MLVPLNQNPNLQDKGLFLVGPLILEQSSMAGPLKGLVHTCKLGSLVSGIHIQLGDLLVAPYVLCVVYLLICASLQIDLFIHKQYI